MQRPGLIPRTDVSYITIQSGFTGHWAKLPFHETRTQAGPWTFYFLPIRIDPKRFTSLLSQDGCETFYFPPVTGWIRNVLFPSCHRVDPKRFTSPLSQGGSELLYFPPVTGSTRNVLLSILRNLNTGWTRSGLLPITIIFNHFQGSKICPISSVLNLVVNCTAFLSKAVLLTIEIFLN